MLFRPQLRQVQDHLLCLVHRGERAIFEFAVEVHASREEVGAGQPHERQACAVRTAAYGAYDRVHAGHFHGFERLVDHLRAV